MLTRPKVEEEETWTDTLSSTRMQINRQRPFPTFKPNRFEQENNALARFGAWADRLLGVVTVAVAVVGSGLPVFGQTPDFADLSLEQLTQYEVTTLGRKNATCL